MFSCPNRSSVCDGTCHDCPKRTLKNKKFVFLDIDGVLNSRQFLKNAGETKYADKFDPTDLEIGMGQMSPKLIARLNALVHEDVVFVLSSMWRRFYKVALVQEMLQAHGFKGTLIGGTPCLADRSRGHEIASWLQTETGIELSRGQLAWPAFVILDDNADMDRLMGKLVQTDYEDGLQDEHIIRARQMLGLL